MPDFEIKPYHLDYHRDLLRIWEKAVLATHDFLKEEDFSEIKSFLEGFDFNLLNVFVLTVQTKMIGFIGVSDTKIEMLFVDPDEHSKGYGTQLLQFAIQKLQANVVSVNEQNVKAVAFYKKAGFVVNKRTDLDDQGRAYPILTMKLIEKEKEVENMEVHHHAHHDHGKKTWKSYFWEFFMLFLAVFCGFLAELQLEHYVEHQREESFMQTMVEDISSDMIQLDSTLNRWKSVNNSIDSVISAINLTGGKKTDYLKIYRNIHEALNYWGFTYNTRTLSQLKNAGGFRLIKDEKVALNLIQYDQFNYDAAVKIDNQHNQLYLNTCKVRGQILNEQLISFIESQYPNQSAPYTINEKIVSYLRFDPIPISREKELGLLFELKNSLSALKRDYMKNMVYNYSVNMRKMREIKRLIEQTYFEKN